MLDTFPIQVYLGALLVGSALPLLWWAVSAPRDREGVTHRLQSGYSHDLRDVILARSKAYVRLLGEDDPVRRVKVVGQQLRAEVRILGQLIELEMLLGVAIDGEPGGFDAGIGLPRQARVAAEHCRVDRRQAGLFPHRGPTFRAEKEIKESSAKRRRFRAYRNYRGP